MSVTDLSGIENSLTDVSPVGSKGTAFRPEVVPFVPTVTTTSANNIGKDIDAGISIVLGIGVLVIAPRQIRHQIMLGKIDEAKGMKMSKLVWPVGCIMVAYGRFKFLVR